MRESLVMRKRVLGEKHPDVAQSLNNLAALLYHQTRHKENEISFQGDIANIFDDMFRYRRVYDEAEAYARESVYIYRNLENEHLRNLAGANLAESLSTLAVLLRRKVRFTEA